MKKCFVAVLLLLMLSAMIFNAAFAVSATPVERIALRTGPNTQYAELFTLPISTDIDALAFESGNGITWVLVEFVYDGQVQRGYTGLKRLDVHGDLEFADYSYTSRYLNDDAIVYAAPYENAAVRGEVHRDELVTLLEREGNYFYIDYYDNSSMAFSRGYVNAAAVEGEPDDPFIGEWGEPLAGRAQLTIKRMNEGGYEVFIYWSSSAFEHSEWSMTGEYDASIDAIVCNDCKHVIVSYDENDIPHEDLQYTDGQAIFTLVDGAIYWYDAQENAGMDIEFVQ